MNTSEQAYREGYDASRTGNTDGNPYLARVDNMTIWWNAGFQDHQLGRPHRFNQRRNPS